MAACMARLLIPSALHGGVSTQLEHPWSKGARARMLEGGNGADKTVRKKFQGLQAPCNGLKRLDRAAISGRRGHSHGHGSIGGATCALNGREEISDGWVAGPWEERLLAGMLSIAAWLLVGISPPEALALANKEGKFPCEDPRSYYAQLDGLAGPTLKERLHDVIAEHRTYTYAQVWDALKILDAADESSPESSPDVIEVYTRQRVAKDLAAKPEGWNREHLWPRSFGLVLGQPQFTDLHNLRPADVNVNSSRGNKVFGECSPQADASCLMPANREAASDTAADRQIWMPPGEIRGDIARALFYMAVRYDGSTPGNVDLELTDKPNVAEARMGLLSVLLRWNVADPPSPSEQLRNERVCSMFQHNRNPFVDHPEYAAVIWGGGAAPLQSVGLLGPSLPAWINELHYDNNGTDQGEFVEVVVAPNVDPNKFSVLLYNGKDGKVYGSLPLSTFAPGQTTLTGYKIFAKYLPQGGLQNGPADGLALVQDSSLVLQFLSYEGSLTAKEGSASGFISSDIGVQESDSTPPNSSLGLTGPGRSYFDFRWVQQEKGATFGALNNGQVLF